MTVAATLRRPVPTALVSGVIAFAALTAGVLVGETLAGQTTRSPAPSLGVGVSRTTGVGQLTTLGFTHAQAKQLINQFDSGPGDVQLMAAEAIAAGAVWGPMPSHAERGVHPAR
jgi:hypothetical protein